METVVYFLTPKQKEQNIKEDFKKLVSGLSERQVELTKLSETRYKISYSDRPHVSHIELSLPAKDVFQRDAGKITLETTRADSVSIYSLRAFARDIGYRVFSVELGSYLPEAPWIRDLLTLSLSPEIQKAFALYGLEPLFLAETNPKHTFYARKKDGGQVHIVNPFLMEYHLAWGEFNSKSPEFNYEVAPNLERFVQYLDRNLVPIYFYEKYGKDLKIRNTSEINIDNPGRKLFVKPIVYQIDDENFRFFMKQGEKGSMIVMDKIREGETLDAMLNRVLKDWGLADGYLRAFVADLVEFDKDKEGIITPRIIVHVYVEKLLKKPAGSDRSWEPIKDSDV